MFRTNGYEVKKDMLMQPWPAYQDVRQQLEHTSFPFRTKWLCGQKETCMQPWPAYQLACLSRRAATVSITDVLEAHKLPSEHFDVLQPSAHDTTISMSVLTTQLALACLSRCATTVSLTDVLHGSAHASEQYGQKFLGGLPEHYGLNLIVTIITPRAHAQQG